MKIVALDAYCLNPGDLSWDALREFGEVVLYDRTPAAEVVSRARGAAAVLTNKTPLTAGTLAELPDLKYIGVLATGYNVVDVNAARGQGIIVTNVPTYGTASVAQFVFALLLELCHNVKLHANAVRAGEWSKHDASGNRRSSNSKARPWASSDSAASGAGSAKSPTPWACASLPTIPTRAIPPLTRASAGLRSTNSSGKAMW
jgi:lactate dehydrogenase-like 2-hydroxyacid dehydrogenase